MSIKHVHELSTCTVQVRRIDEMQKLPNTDKFAKLFYFTVLTH